MIINIDTNLLHDAFRIISPMIKYTKNSKYGSLVQFTIMDKQLFLYVFDEIHTLEFLCGNIESINISFSINFDSIYKYIDSISGIIQFNIQSNTVILQSGTNTYTVDRIITDCDFSEGIINMKNLCKNSILDIYKNELKTIYKFIELCFPDKDLYKEIWNAVYYDGNFVTTSDTVAAIYEYKVSNNSDICIERNSFELLYKIISKITKDLGYQIHFYKINNKIIINILNLSIVLNEYPKKGFLGYKDNLLRKYEHTLYLNPVQLLKACIRLYSLTKINKNVKINIFEENLVIKTIVSEHSMQTGSEIIQIDKNDIPMELSFIINLSILIKILKNFKESQIVFNFSNDLSTMLISNGKYIGQSSKKYVICIDFENDGN